MNGIQVITAPSSTKAEFPSVFLAGGITNCKNWQEMVIDNLKYTDVSVFNPRRDHFDVTDKWACREQIEWEFDHLETMDIFSIYFCDSKSDQPICMYELGRNLIRMQNRFPSDWQHRIVISVESGYKRKNDVLIQTELCAPGIFVDADGTPESHAHFIKKCVYSIKWEVNYICR